MTPRGRAAPWAIGGAIVAVLSIGVVVGANLAQDEDALPTPGPRRSPGVEVSSDRARATLCRRPPLAEPEPQDQGSLPAAVATIVQQAEQVRELRFERPVRPEAISRERMGQEIARALERSYPREMMDRRTQAWRTIG
ncbi:MAG TPA: hypothetical protein VEO00_13470, partial [Actinomycetota bacterium]|nr:hypothetical protein [Actinomycetota bacterium]